MITIRGSNIGKSYGVETILKDISFHVNQGERVGIVGGNGEGKTTLLRILAGDEEADSGHVHVSSECKLGYLRQDNPFDSENTIIREVEGIFHHLEKMEIEMLKLSNQIANLSPEDESHERGLQRYDDMVDKFKEEGGYRYKSDIRGVLTNMGFDRDRYNDKISSLSGGEKTRLSLGLLLLSRPEILLLDEPTNHLDISTLTWLEQYLKAYAGTVIVVSHDRYFLDKLVDKIFEVEGGSMKIFTGSYSQYVEKKKEILETQLREYEKQSREIKKQEEIVRRFKGHGTEKLAKRAASREKKLSKMETVEKPKQALANMGINFEEKYKSGNDVLFLEDVGMNFGEGYSGGAMERERGEERKNPLLPQSWMVKGDEGLGLFSNVNLHIRRGERICLVGTNGVGKTTLMKIILGKMKNTAGKVTLGHNVKMGYFDQEQQQLDYESTVIEDIHNQYRRYTHGQLRGILGKFLFRGDDVFLKIKNLSGGERARLTLLKLMLSGSNFLLMDEPTNHLDIGAKDVFEEALMEFPGTVFVISHDRYFLKRIPTKIVEMTQGGIEIFQGNYDYYLEKKGEEQSGKRRGVGDKIDDDPARVTDSQKERQRRKREEAGKRRQEREKNALEKTIEELEELVSAISEQMGTSQAINDYTEMERLSEALDGANDKLEEAYEKWLQY